MTLKELKNNILLFLYHLYKSGKFDPKSFKDVCSLGNIEYDSEMQLHDAFSILKDDGYIDVVFYQTGNGDVIRITPLGIEYVEENLLTEEEKQVDAFKDTTRAFQNGATIDVEPNDEDENIKQETTEEDGDREETISKGIIYDTLENYKETLDQGVPPCFGIDTLANCYIKQMDQIAIKADEKFRMLGIFGPWGRGKTYFFNRIKTILNGRQKSQQGKVSDESKIMNYKIVEFNAWKYQDTPAIWAYLYENLYSSLDKCQKSAFWVRSFGKKILLLLAVLCAAWLLNIFISWVSDVSDDIKNYINVIQIPLAWITTIGTFIYAYINKPFTVQKQINNYIKRKSYNNILGIQSDLESDIEQLLKYIIPKPEEKQLLLFVDDIDRCTSDKMIHIINSLRIILENKEIQKRLIVICSVDAEKLKEGYCLSKNVERENERFLEEAREHLDKLFIFSIGLSPIDYNQQLEYLERLTDLKKSNNEKTESTIPFSTSRSEGSFAATSSSNEIPKFDDNYIYEIMKDFLFKHQNIEFTPRKIRIMYYRLLFANNIIASGKARITYEIAIKILEKSVNFKENISNNKAMSDVIHCVVPY